MFGFSPFASAAFSDIKETDSNVVELVGLTLTAIIDGVGVSADGSISVDPNDDVGTGQIGTVSVVGVGNEVVSGVEATASLGSVLVQATSTTALTSLSTSALLGTVSVALVTPVAVSGLSASGEIGSVTSSAGASVTPTGLEATASTASVSILLSQRIRVTGVTATGQVGTATAVAGCKVSVTGVQAAALVTTPLVWSVINDNQTPNWIPVDDTQSDSWVQVNDGNNVVWTQIPT
jgi:hypothetical protein